MAYQLIAQGNGLSSASILADYDSYFAEGDRGELRLTLRTPLSDSILSRLDSEAVSRGATLWDASRMEGDTLIIRGEQGGPWLIIIAAVIVLVIVLYIIIKWEIYKVVPGVGNWAFAGATALPLVVSSFGPAEPRKAKALLFGSLVLTGYTYHYLGSRGLLPKMVQDLYDELVGRRPGNGGNGGDGDHRIQKAEFFPTSRFPYNPQDPLLVPHGYYIRPVLSIWYSGSLGEITVYLGFAHHQLLGREISFWMTRPLTAPDHSDLQGITIAIGEQAWPPYTANYLWDAFIAVCEPGTPIMNEGPDSKSKGILFRQWFNSAYLVE